MKKITEKNKTNKEITFKDLYEIAKKTLKAVSMKRLVTVPDVSL